MARITPIASRMIPTVTRTASFATRRPITSRMMPRIIMRSVYPATAKQTWAHSGQSGPESAQRGLEAGAQVSEPFGGFVGEDQTQVPAAAGPPAIHGGGGDLRAGEQPL